MPKQGGFTKRVWRTNRRSVTRGIGYQAGTAGGLSKSATALLFLGKFAEAYVLREESVAIYGE
jgi:hypothetical protein